MLYSMYVWYQIPSSDLFLLLSGRASAVLSHSPLNALIIQLEMPAAILVMCLWGLECMEELTAIDHLVRIVEEDAVIRVGESMEIVV